MEKFNRNPHETSIVKDMVKLLLKCIPCCVKCCSVNGNFAVK